MKKRLSSQNQKFWAHKNTLLNRNHVLATTGQSFYKENGTLFPKKYQYLIGFLAKRKNGRFSVIPAGTRSVVNVGHFFSGPDGPTKLR